MNPEHQKLIQDSLEGQLNKEQEEELRNLMKHSAALREEYCSQSLVHARLEWEMKREDEEQPVRKHKSIPFILPLSAAALALLGIGIYQIYQSPIPGDQGEITTANPPETQPLRSIARITASKDARWHSPLLRDKEWLFPGQVKLQEGSATIVFDSGAQVTLAAPCHFELVDSNKGRLHSGTLSAEVPEPAIGFTVDTPETTITDLSTSFGVSVSEEKNEVQVFEGEVLVSYGKGSSNNKLIQQSSAYAYQPEKELTPVSYTPENFPRPLAPTKNTTTDKSLGHIHWSFDEIDTISYASSGTLLNADTFPAKLQNTKFPASTQTSGQFGKALHLSGDETFLTTQFPGVAGAGARTIAFWVRIPPNAKPKNAYAIIGWGHPALGQQSQKWEIGWNTGKFPEPGTGVFGAIRTDFGLGHTIGTTNLRDGRWHHITSVFTGGRDADAATHIRHYVDGRLEGISAYQSQPIDTGSGTNTPIPAIIGRYLVKGNQDFQSFHGSIDELYLLNAALTPAQILELRDNNTPPQPEDLIYDLKN